MTFGKRNGPPTGATAPSFSPPRPAPSFSIGEEAAIAAAVAPTLVPALAPAQAASYMPLDPYLVRERLEESRARLAARHEEKSRRARERVAQAEIRPFCLIPETLWSGKWAELLSARLALFPHDDWNIAFLAADEASAVLLDLPAHPGTPAATDEIERYLAEAELQLATGYADAERARNFSQYAQEREEIRDKLVRLARKVLFAIDEAWARSKQDAED